MVFSMLLTISMVTIGIVTLVIIAIVTDTIVTVSICSLFTSGGLPQASLTFLTKEWQIFSSLTKFLLYLKTLNLFSNTGSSLENVCIVTCVGEM